MNIHKIAALVSILVFCISISTFYAHSTADARARGGGRSFGSSRSYRPSTPYSSSRRQSSSASRSRSGNSFLKGLGGGLLGGFLGSLLFGSLAHAGGGLFGTGLGLFQLLIIGGIGYFIYKKFLARNGTGNRNPGSVNGGSQVSEQGYVSPPSPPPHGHSSTIDAPPPSGASGYAGSNAAPPPVDEQQIKELAQDIFFKVQAAWMRRDIDAVRDILGPELLGQYEAEFQDMKARGLVNRLENIAVRNVEIVDHGTDSGFEYVKVKFTANLLDYTVEEATGNVVQGSDSEPVKFQEIWTFARPEGSSRWQLYAIEH